MAELQPLVDVQINGCVDVPPVVDPPDTAAVNPPKRQRKPSVRLGDIGDQNTYANQRRTKQHQWKFGSKDSKSSKTRPLVNLTTGAGGGISGEFQLSGEVKGIGNENNCNMMINGGSNCNYSNGLIGSWKAARVCSKSKRGFSSTKRVRSNWGSKMEEGDEKFHDVDVYDYNDNDNNDDDNADESLNFSMDNENEDLNYDGEDRGKEIRVRVSDGPSDTDGRNWNNDNNSNPERNGVRVWLNQLGLGRYASVFEVHEVDDEVLPSLTLEDLKDMGINAVGSRRKMFCSIQKLGKGFS